MTIAPSSPTRSSRAVYALDMGLAVLIFILALLPRLDVAWAYTEAPQSEERLYDRYAWAWAQGEGAEPRDKVFPWHPLGSFTHRPPLYSLFLGSLYVFFGHDLTVVRLAQAGLGALTCVLVFVLGRQWAGRWVGLGAALLMTYYSFLINFTGRIMSEPLFILLQTLALVLLMRARSGSLPVLFGAGLVLGLADLTRPVLLLPFIPLLVIWLWFTPFRRRPLHALVTLGLGMALIFAPVVLRNYQFHGRFVFISSNSGYTFFHGLDRTDGLTNPDALPERGVIQDLELGELNEQARFREEALKYLRQYPQDIPTIMAAQAAEFTDAVQGYKISDVVIPVPEDPILWPILGLGGLLSLIVFPTRAFHARSLLYLTIASHVLMGLVFHAEVRYRLPFAPLLALLTCWVAWCVLETAWGILRQGWQSLRPRPVGRASD